MTRSEHLDWCKKRALGYVDNNDNLQAFASMASGLNMHRETENHIGIELGMAMLLGGQLDTQESMRKFIEGFN